MSNQSTVDLRIANATPGLIADIHAGNQIISRAAEAVVAFGIIVAAGTDANSQAVPGGDANDILGVSVRSVGKEALTVGATELDYQPTEAMSIMQSGYIFVKTSGGASAGDTAKFVNATGLLESVEVSAAIAGETIIDDSRFQEDIAPGAVGRLWVNNINALTAGS